MDLKNFLYLNKSSPSFGYTHTTIPGNFPGGSYYISKKETKNFRDIYHNYVFVDKQPTHLTESPDPSGFSPLKVDIDFKYTSKKIKRKYTNDMLKDIVRYHFDSIKKWLVTPLRDEEKLCFVFEKQNPISQNFKENIVKDGIHLMWPHMITPWAFHRKVRKHVVDASKKNKIFENMKLVNLISDVFDSSIINRNNWLMYGSSKYKKEPYLLTKIYKCEDVSIDNEIIENGSSKNGNDTKNKIVEIEIDREKYNPRYLIDLLSIQNRKDDISMFKIEKEHEIKLEQDKEIKIKATKNKPTYSKDKKSGKMKCCKTELKSVFEYINMLDIKRAVDYKLWIELVWCLHNIHNIDNKLLKKLIEFSKKSPIHKEEAEDSCKKEWNNATKQGGLGIGSLKYWARLDSPVKYKKFQDENNWEKVKNTVLSIPMTQYDVAEVLYGYSGDIYKCANSRNKLWYCFNNHRWNLLESPIKLKKHLSTTIFKSFQKFYNKYTSNEDLDIKKATEIFKNICKLKQTKFKKDVMEESAELFYDDEQKFQLELDEKYNLIGFKNGVYDLNKSYDENPFRPGRPEDNISMTTGIDYCEYSMEHGIVIEIYEFIDKIFPNKDIREYILTLFSSFLNGSTKSEQFHFWTGSGGNGKSKIIELFEKSFGDYCCKLPIQLLTQKRKGSSQANPELARTKGKRFACLQEPDKGAKINSGLLKELTGGDKIMARKLYQDFIEIKPQFKMVLCCNDLPKLPPNDGGIWRRVRVVEFKSRFVNNPNKNDPCEFKKDEDLSEKFHLWKEAFMWILLNQYQKVYKCFGIQEPDEIIKYTRKYKQGLDRLLQFTNEFVETCDKDERIKVTEIYPLYQNFIKTNFPGGKLIARNEFIIEMDRKLRVKHSDPQRVKKINGKKIIGNGTNGWWGFKISYANSAMDFN